MLLLHRGLPQQAVQVLDTAPEQFQEWYNGMWRPWYAALWAEAAVLSGHEDAAARIQRARLATAGNPIATAIVDRAAALDGRDGDRDGLTAAAAALEDAGLPLPVGPDTRLHRRGATSTWRVRAGDDGRDAYGLASRMMLNGVSVARRTWVNPASRSTIASWRSPACAPSPSPTSCASDPGVQMTVDRP